MDSITGTSTNLSMSTLEVLSSVYSYDEECPGETDPFRRWLLSCYVLFFIFGVFGNGMLVLLFLTKKNLRTINNALVTNLAFSDLLFVIFYVPIKYFEEKASSVRPFGVPFCVISILINYTSQDVSTMSMTALSYLRYLAVVHPLQLRRQDDGQVKRYILLCCVITWVVGIAAAVFPTTDCSLLRDNCWIIDRHYVNSFENKTHHLIFHSVRFTFFYLLPLFVITFLYSVMAFKLCRAPSALERPEPNSPARRAIRSRRKTGGVVVAIVIIFFLSWLPNYLAWFNGLDDNKFSGWLTTTRSVCMFLPASLNPLLLFFASKEYQKSFFQILLFWRQPDSYSALPRVSLATRVQVGSIRLSRLGKYSNRSSSNVPSSK